MHNMYRKIFYISFCLVLSLVVFAQGAPPIAFPDEIKSIGGKGYVGGIPFTGKLVDPQTMKDLGEFRNGLKHGVFKSYYDNGLKKSEETYLNGVLNGTYSEWFKNGAVKVEASYSDGQLSSRWIEWFSNGQVKVVYHFLKGKIIDGDYIVYLETGGKEKLQVYQGGQMKKVSVYNGDDLIEPVSEKYANGKLKSSGYLKNGKMNDIWTWWYENGDKKREAVYVDGTMQKLLYENNLDPAFKIISNRTPGSYFFMILSTELADTLFVKVRFNFSNQSRINELKENIIGALENRFDLIDESDLAGHLDKELNYEMLFDAPKVSTIYDDGKSESNYKYVTVTTNVSPGYRGNVSVGLRLTEVKSSKDLISTLLGNKSSIYPTESEAITAAPSLIRGQVIDKMYGYFNIQSTVGGIVERDRKGYVKLLRVMCGENFNLAKGFEFFILDKDLKIGQISVISIDGNTSVAKITSGEMQISSALESKKKLTAISIY